MVVGDVATGTEVLVVGGGPGGYSAAIRAAQLGKNVTLVEKGDLGGTCLNRGCIPAKALLSATGFAEKLENAEDMGIQAEVTIDPAGLFTWTSGIIDQLSMGVEELCTSNGVTHLGGTATFVDEQTARIAHGGGGQGSETLEFEHAIIATGSRPAEHPAIDTEHPRVWTPETALERGETLESLLVLGADYIAIELATIFARMGTEVELVAEASQLLPRYEPDIAGIIEERLVDQGVDVHLERDIISSGGLDDRVTIETNTPEDEGATHEADAAIVSVGREPVTADLDLASVGIDTDTGGFIETDVGARSSVDRIYAVGDVTGEPLLAHYAIAEGIVAAGSIAGEPVAMDQVAIPSVIYTDPEIATVGLTEAAAEDAGYDPIVGSMPMRASGRAITLDEQDGYVRIVADAETGFILGGQIVAPHASELIGEVALAIELAATLEDIEDPIHAHPTLTEAIEEAALNARNRAIHTLNR